ncbi:vanadium-dependent haloperoxidase [Actinomycetospora atypica]|uniref:Phosphatase PAP2 family protein n=1 Tax=Actinomycetospora atypica TaxID=1290095 RepID=A0ABV9YNH7_9PSEU
MDPILYWNEALLEVNARDHTGPEVAKTVPTRGPTGSSRAFAMVSLAMRDAVVAVKGNEPTYTGMTYTGPGTDTARDAAVAAAAQSVLSALWPEHEDFIVAHATAQPMPAGPGLDDGHRLGVGIATAMLARRASDGADNPMPYAASSAYGRHRVDPVNPTQPYLGPLWGQVAHFALGTRVQLDPPPGYHQADYLTDDHYRADHDEVRHLGALASTSRTPEQTLIGIFWAYDGVDLLGTPPRFYNQILRHIATSHVNPRTGELNTPEDNAELFALANVAMADAGIDAWHWKYYYNLWRPVIGIREACSSNGPSGIAGPNNDADCDPFWVPLGAPATNQTVKPDFTPPFPAYPSGHATFGAALFQIIRLFYGGEAITIDEVLAAEHEATPDEGYVADLISDELNGTTTDSRGHLRTRHVRRFTDLVTPLRENALSRVYLGVHWRFDGLPRDPADRIGGVPLGLEVAETIFDTGLTGTTTRTEESAS